MSAGAFCLWRHGSYFVLFDSNSSSHALALRLAVEAPLAGQDLIFARVASQPSPLLNAAVYPNGNGFDFGMSQPRTGLGYGLLGNTQSLAAQQPCDDCLPGATCSGGCDGNQGQTIKTQGPRSFPGLLPPPPVGLQPSRPPDNIIIGDPNAWWNWTPGEIWDWFRGAEARRPDPAVERACEDQVNADKSRCYALARKATAEAGRERGARELDSCIRTAEQRYGNCLKNKGKTTIPEYPDWYEDPPYPDDSED